MIDPYSLGLHVTHITNNEAYCTCPYHNDNAPSASFNMDKGLFHCYACGKNASAKTVATDLGGYVIQTSEIKKVRERDDDDWEWILLAPFARDNGYLQSRGVSNKQVEKFEIRSVKGGVAFINHDISGRAIGAQIRRYSGFPRYLFYGKKAELWPMSNVFVGAKMTYIVEGVFGALRAESAGQVAVASMSAGTISGVAKTLNGRPKTVVFDNDFAGHLGAAKLMAITNSTAIVPGCEADELDAQTWQSIGKTFELAHHWSDFLQVTSDPEKLKRIVQAFVRNTSRVTRRTSPASPGYVRVS